MNAIWTVAKSDVKRWMREPMLILATLIPAAGMAIMVLALTYAVGRQPVALVGHPEGLEAERMVSILRTSDGFFLSESTHEQAMKDLKDLKVAAVIEVPDGFDEAVARHEGYVDTLINNVDLDFADDVRRSISEAVVEIDAPPLATLGEEGPEAGSKPIVANPYQVHVAETDLRYPDISFLSYELVPVFPLLALTAGALITALALSGDRETGVLTLFALAPRARIATVGGHLLGGFLASSLLIGTALGVAALTGAVDPPAGRWPAVIALLVATSLSAVGIGVVIGLATRSRPTTILVGVNVVAASFLLGGGFTTIAFMPDAIQAAARFVPTFYSVTGIREALFYAEMPTLGRNLIVLTGAAVVSIAVGAIALTSVGRRR